jgi:LmbE family N-acetylglucosaminyl deacetylase
MKRHSCVRSALAFILFLAAPHAAWPRADTPNQEMLKTDLLVVTAHPDDESMMAATMARYTDEGKVVALVSCTRGEGGGNGTGKEGGAALGIIREAELRKCLGILGVRHLYFLNQPDWAYTESVQATLAKWGHDETLRRLVRLVRLLRPEVICTMDPAPVGGQHGHHQAAGRLATEAFEAAADPNLFPELQRDEGIGPWRVRKLYWTSFGQTGTVRIATDGLASGTLASAHAGKRYADIGWEAARQHRSQGFDKFFASLAGASKVRFPARPNSFVLVKSRILINPHSEKDLFDGIAGARVDSRDTQHDVLASGLAAAPAAAPVTAQLRPRHNVRNYRTWLRSNGIERLLTRLPAHVSVVQGRADNLLEVEVTNRTAESQTGKLSLRLPSGWTLARSEEAYAVPANSTAVVSFRCPVPADAAVKSHDISVQLGKATDNGKLDVVPALTIGRLVSSLPVDADVQKWENLKVAAVPISRAGGFQGRVASPQECSGRFFTGYDEQGLQILVDVTDDTVVRNIAPDDIKAHWRSTSVEICLDPAPPSENTFGTLKLGIFPQDTTGTVRAARDADARPGPLEHIKSRIRLASRLTPAGYVVEAHIPWQEIGLSVDRSALPGSRLGFNVILYHAGKKNARIGEDIGKSRLAWSFWPGAPGRPEVWGQAMLR